jgi:hypothetical protein
MQIKGKRGIILFVAHTINFSQNSALFKGLVQTNAELKEKRGINLFAATQDKFFSKVGTY